MSDGASADGGTGTMDAGDARGASGEYFSFTPVPDDAPDYESRMAPVWERLGRPKSHSDYKWTDPTDFHLDDTDKAYRDAMSRVFHREGLSQRQVRAIEKAQFEQLKLLNDSRAAARQGAAERTKMILRDEWGASEIEPRLSKANEALVRFGGKSAKTLAQLELADGTPLGAHADFVKLMARAAEAGGGGSSAGGGGAKNVAKLEAQIESIEREAMMRGLSPTHPMWPHKQLDGLYKQAYGSRNRGPQPFMSGRED